MKHIAIYVRVSNTSQKIASQEPDLKTWVKAHANGDAVKWYTDHFTGRTMERPGWRDIQLALLAGEVDKIVVWRLDRLGRTAAGLTTLFNELIALDVTLVSLKESIDLSTTSGRLMANVIASLAQWETESRSERVKAGIERAKAEGKRWGGSKKGVRRKVTDAKITAIKHLRESGSPISEIVKAVGLGRTSIYQVIHDHLDG